ncbi:MAG: hypothetical protein MJZ11_08215 [Lachnospiraceae bacterium]|nr:hypothetical protein [Lachnospiraceae bacterium]
MYYYVANTKTKEVVYKVKNDLHNAATERDMLNAPYPFFDWPYVIVCGKVGLERCGYKENYK